MPDALILVVSLLIILAGSELLTNALEHLGERLGLSTGITGSVFAAVATALPETLVPLVAIIGGGEGSRINEEIGIGAILGAPLMLATLTFLLIGLMAIFRRGWRAKIEAEPSGLRRDLRFFLLALLFALGALFIPHHQRWARALIASLMVLIYTIYLWRTFAASRNLVKTGHATEADTRLFAAHLGLGNNMAGILVQLALGLGFIIGGARGFVVGITRISESLGISALFLALIIVPFATELPEKMNSLIWIVRRRDTLAVGNITGALVFQSTLLPALGVLLTAWEPRPDVKIAIAITLAAGAWLLILSHLRRLPALALVANGIAYALYFTLLLH